MNDVQTDCTGYELALGSLHGYRRFRVDRLGRLTALHHPFVWRPGENVATCKRKKHTVECRKSAGRYFLLDYCGCPASDEPAFHSDHCSCGFYAFLDCTETRYGDYSGLVVGGVIEGYGKTLVGTKGFRCEKGAVVAVVIPRRIRSRNREAIDRLRRNYPDVEVLTSPRQAARRFGINLKAVAQAPDNDPNFWERP